MPNQHLTIDNYLDLAKEQQGLTSDSKLSQVLNVQRAAVSTWRKGRAWPSPDHMAEIAELANKDPEVALLDLDIWRNEGPAKLIYMKIASRLIANAAMLAIVFVAFSPSLALAEQTRNNATLYLPTYTLCDLCILHPVTIRQL